MGGGGALSKSKKTFWAKMSTQFSAKAQISKNHGKRGAGGGFRRGSGPMKVAAPGCRGMRGAEAGRVTGGPKGPGEKKSCGRIENSPYPFQGIDR